MIKGIKGETDSIKEEIKVARGPWPGGLLRSSVEVASHSPTHLSCLKIHGRQI